MILLGWLEIAAILDNPFGYHKEYDIDLFQELDVHIWRCSLTLENQGFGMEKEGKGPSQHHLEKALWNLIYRPDKKEWKNGDVSYDDNNNRTVIMIIWEENLVYGTIFKKII